MARGASAGVKVITYARVSTEEQGDSQLGLQAQSRVLGDWSAAHSSVIEKTRHISDVASASTTERLGLERALLALSLLEYDTLVVTKLDRLSRSVADFAELCERAQAEGWAIIALDIGVDMTTATGKMVANILMSVAQWEREMIGQRTREALAAKKARGERAGGPEPRPISAEARDLIAIMEPWFTGWEACSAALNACGYSTPQGNTWARNALYGWVMRNKALVGHPGAEEVGE